MLYLRASIQAGMPAEQKQMRVWCCMRLQDYMEQPLDSSDIIDIEGFEAIIVGDEHHQVCALRPVFQCV